MSRGVSYTDSGELAAAVATLGIAHPTGYPLFTIVGHLWTYLPISSSVIFELNVFAAFLIALSAGFVFLIAKLLIMQEKFDALWINLISATVAFTYSFAITIWQQSTSIEVYPLQILIFTLIIYFAILANKYNSFILWLITSFVTGLGFSNHLTTLFIIPGLFIFYFKRKEKGFDFSKQKLTTFLYLSIPFLIALSLYIYLPLRSSTFPLVNWGWVHRGMTEFLYHVQGKQYQIWMFSGEKLGDNISKFFGLMPLEYGYFGIFIGLAGIYKMLMQNKQIALFLIINFIFSFFYAVNYSIHDIDSYFSLSFIIFTLFIPFGIIFIFRKLNKNYLYLILILPLINLSINYKDVDSSHNYLVEDYTKSIADCLDDNAIIISAQWDYFNSSFIYYQNVEQYRTDVTVIEKELLRRTWYPLQLAKISPEILLKCKPQLELYSRDLENFEKGADPYTYRTIQFNYINLIRTIIDSNLGERPVYLTFDIIQQEPEIIKGYKLIPKGLTFQISNEILADKFKFNQKNFKRFIEMAQTPKSYLDSGIVNMASLSFLNTGRYYQAYGKLAAAIEAYSLSLRVKPDNYMANDLLNKLKK